MTVQKLSQDSNREELSSIHLVKAGVNSLNPIRIKRKANGHKPLQILQLMILRLI